MKIFLAMAVICSSLPPLFSQDRDEKIIKLTDEFNVALEAGKNEVLKTFDSFIEKAKNGTISASTRAALITTLTADRNRFEKTGVWPENDDLADVAIRYSILVNAKYVPLHLEYEKAIDRLLKSNDVDAANILSRRKTNLERKISGRDKFTSNKSWEGVRQGAGGSVSKIRLQVQRMTGNLFDGQLHLDPDIVNHPIIQVRGTVNGSYIEIATVKMLNGKARNFHFRGFILGNRILFEITGIAANKKAFRTLAWLKG